MCPMPQNFPPDCSYFEGLPPDADALFNIDMQVDVRRGQQYTILTHAESGKDVEMLAESLTQLEHLYSTTGLGLLSQFRTRVFNMV